MTTLDRAVRDFVKKIRSHTQSTLLSYPKDVECNVCGWEGSRFLSDAWHKHIICPKCRSDIRQRLFLAALQNLDPFSFGEIIHDKTILHFAPEEVVGSILRKKSSSYVTADYFRHNSDLQIDISDMPSVKDESFDVVIAFDVLEHVPDYKKGLAEIHRVLSGNGFAIFTVPQKDQLEVTYEDPSMTTPEDRTLHFGHFDHHRIYGNDFSAIVEEKGFLVTEVSETMFSPTIVRKHVLFPPVLSKNPLATNYRKVFYCQKI
jgi:SAM-dependent methyltransferase